MCHGNHKYETILLRVTKSKFIIPVPLRQPKGFENQLLSGQQIQVNMNGSFKGHKMHLIVYCSY
jgi:hypothetical protein